MLQRKGILPIIHVIQHKQFSETNVTSHAFQQISDLKIFPECFCRPQKTLWRATWGPWPVVGPHWLRSYACAQKSLKFIGMNTWNDI